MRKNITIAICLLFTIISYSQNHTITPSEKVLEVLSSKRQKNDYLNYIKHYNDRSDSAYQCAISLLKDIDTSLIYRKEIGDIYYFISRHQGEKQFKYHAAIESGTTALKIYRKLSLEKEAGQTLAMLGEYNYDIGDMNASFNNIVAATRLATSQGDTLTIRNCSLIMERIHYYYYQDKKTALAYNRFVASESYNREEHIQRVKAINNLFFYSPTKELTDSIVKTTEELCNKHNIKEQLVNVYLNATLRYTDLNELELSKEYLEKSLPLLRNIKDSGYYYSASGYYYLHRENHTETISELNKAIKYLEKGDFNPQMLLRSYDILQWIYMTMGDYENGYNCLMKVTDIYINLVSEEKVIELSKSLNELERNIQNRQTESQKKVMWILLLSVIIIFGTTSAFFYSQIQKRRLENENISLQQEKHHQELKSKNDIIKVKQLQLYQMNLFIEHLIEDLEKVNGLKENSSMRSNLKQVIRELENNKESTDWIEVEKSLAGNDNSFLEKLVKDFPDLTANERRLCAFMHLNMSTKEISNITHQSINGINAARTRLRKKFGLTGDDKSLIAFLDRYDQHID